LLCEVLSGSANYPLDFSQSYNNTIDNIYYYTFLYRIVRLLASYTVICPSVCLPVLLSVCLWHCALWRWG